MEQLVGCELQQMRAAAAAGADGDAAQGAKHADSCSAGTALNFLQVRWHPCG
jgi:hypothetical protein